MEKRVINILSNKSYIALGRGDRFDSKETRNLVMTNFIWDCCELAHHVKSLRGSKCTKIIQ